MFPRTPFVTATSGMLTRLPAKLSKNGMCVYTLSDRRSKKKLRVYTASEAKGVKQKKGSASNMIQKKSYLSDPGP